MPDQIVPIFIHSLFRSGSTFLFNAFRDSAAQYFCYQEPFNEFLLVARNDPEKLLEEHGKTLRHPKMKKPYFYEFYSIKEQIGQVFKKQFCYDTFFTLGEYREDIQAYLNVLLEGAQGQRPVLQFCRSFGRAKEFKSASDVFHIYLWRNPWDQWWSFKVENYFDTANQMILNAFSPPVFFEKIKSELGFVEFHASAIEQEFDHFANRPLSSKNSYFLFYALWCFSLLQNKDWVDLLINIDTLSSSKAYQEEICEQLVASKIFGVDLSSCGIPQGIYSEEDESFFHGVESHVHELILSSGYTPRDLDDLLALKKRHAPHANVVEVNFEQLKRDLGRARSLARRYEDVIALIASGPQKIIAEQAEARARLAEGQARQAEALLVDVEARMFAMVSSKSWRMTSPFRYTVEKLRKLRDLVKCVRS